MKANSKKRLTGILSFVVMIAITTINYIVIRYVLDYLFDLLGGEENIGWKSILLVCAALSVVMIIALAITKHMWAKSKVHEVVAACSNIIIFTTAMFGVSVLFDSITECSADCDTPFKTLHWLSMSISLAIFNYLYERLQQRKIKSDDNTLVVAAECSDMASADVICNTLEANGIKTMIVEKDSPLFIHGSDATVQVQVCRKDLDAAKSYIAK